LELPLPASEYVHRQLWFTPFPTEPVGWLIEECDDDLFLFSSDYNGNFADMMGSRLPVG
jgi:hypothetical protein